LLGGARHGIESCVPYRSIEYVNTDLCSCIQDSLVGGASTGSDPDEVGLGHGGLDQLACFCGILCKVPYVGPEDVRQRFLQERYQPRSAAEIICSNRACSSSAMFAASFRYSRAWS